LPPAGVGTPRAFDSSAAFRADNPDSSAKTPAIPWARSFGFLADGGNDPREAFVESLLEKLAPTSEPIIVHSSYEGLTLEQLASVFKQHRKAIEGVTARLCDLLPIMRGHIYYADFGGSYSIKDVGPVIAPNIRYDDLDYVADGGAAASD